MRFTLKNLLIYSLAWLPYAASYIAVFLYQGRDRFDDALFIALRNIVPAAALGLTVIWLCNRFDWAWHRRAWFFPAHIWFALGYSFVWYASVLLVTSVNLSLQRNAWTPVWFSGYALQWQLFSGVMIYATIASVAYALQIAANLRAEEQRRQAAEKRAREIELHFANQQLAALRAQLNPHFLFNTLHSLMALVRYEPRQAEDALEKLAAMLRYVLPERQSAENQLTENRNLVLFADEWRFVENYLELEKLRFGERLQVQNEIEPRALRCLLPAFTLQPLVENAVKHGIAPRARRGNLRIRAKIAHNKLCIEVSDDGAGAKPEDLTCAAGGLGLRLVREQLELHYGAATEFKIETAPDAGFAVRVALPASAAENLTIEGIEVEYQNVYR